LIELPTPKPRRIAVLASASGSGKTTLARELARRLGARFIELDALRHGPSWAPTPVETMRETLLPLLAGEAWVIDGGYSELGPMVPAAADLVVWLDLPPWVWLPRLVRRSARRLWFREELWNGNRESVRGVFFEWDGVLPYALRSYAFRRGALARRIAPYPHVRLRSVREVEAFLAQFEEPVIRASPSAALR
jgi:hypothetical protein